MSARAEAAKRIADWVNGKRLNRPFGGDVNKSADGRYYGVLFAYPRYLDGLARVYGPKFVLLEMQGPWVHGSSRAVFNSVDDAIKFLQAAFVDHNWEAANAVPRRGA